VPLPAIEIVDMKDERHRKKNNGIFSSVLLAAIRKALAERTQVILFQNRRGYSPFLQCPDCGYIPKCNNCDVSLTVHKAFRALTCHYCGYTENLPAVCPKCGSSNISNMGFGTERIEDELLQIFPEAKIARMDLDTTRTRNAYVKIISSFEAGAVDILIGTQMVSKGLDFKNVSLVGVLNADNLLSYPDFRASEKAFQMLTQVSGRAGRAGKQGRVVLQTSTADSEVIRQVIHNDYQAMFSSQMRERQAFKYPPFFRLIYVEIRHRDQNVANAAADFMAKAMRAVFEWRVLGPDNPPVPRIQNKYIRRIVLKIEATSSNAKAKLLLRSVSDQLLAQDRFKTVQISLDVDPV
jgi:primosomal protein N' (replication factor Y)